MAVAPGAFPASAAPITFTGLASGVEVNGLSAGGVLFSYSLGNGNVVIDGGPGVTNNLNPPNVVSAGDNSGILTLALPSLETMFGYGYAILDTNTVTDATTITLFNGATNVGTLSYNGSPDPSFAGGFAGIQSTVPFDSVQLTFDSVDAPAFALDNVVFASVPEPSAILLVLTGAAALFWLRRPKNSHC
ncbi:MAG: PEP-CTERM sorting domain-containing protein [Candidatus Sulfopaludibacter sp.]|nr:PEP-CTERM sorting domain-containing protein [Candidatus Sulfopaludibacter sp.]